ncbi:MAG: hypothetical protein EHM93_18005, partial [Bacteroidales bacterium]
MKNLGRLFILMAIVVLIIAGCKKESTPIPEDIYVLGYSNLRWTGGDNHYWSIYTINSDGT